MLTFEPDGRNGRVKVKQGAKTVGYGRIKISQRPGYITLTYQLTTVGRSPISMRIPIDWAAELGAKR